MTNDNDYMTDEFGFRFRKWDIYQDARQFRSFVNGFLKTYPNEERFTLTDQTKRALNSVVLNIAEGANRMTDKDTRLYMNRAHTSLDETVACLDCGLDDGYLTGRATYRSTFQGCEFSKEVAEVFQTSLSVVVILSSVI